MSKQINNKDLKKGKLYKMVHSRKGTAIVECVRAYDDGGIFIVREGVLRGIFSVHEVGDEFTTTNNLAKFFEL